MTENVYGFIRTALHHKVCFVLYAYIIIVEGERVYEKRRGKSTIEVKTPIGTDVWFLCITENKLYSITQYNTSFSKVHTVETHVPVYNLVE